MEVVDVKVLTVDGGPLPRQQPPHDVLPFDAVPRRLAATAADTTPRNCRAVSAIGHRPSTGAGTLRHKLLRRGDGLPDNHPAAAYRGAFGDNNLPRPRA